MGVASGCGEQEAGVASGSRWNLWVWLLGVVVRRYRNSGNFGVKIFSLVHPMTKFKNTKCFLTTKKYTYVCVPELRKLDASKI